MFSWAADLQGNPVEANLSCVLTARILWTYSEASILYNNPDYVQMAHLAYQVLQEKFLDPVNERNDAEVQFIDVLIRRCAD
ncbi:MAG: hypothetical protein WC865_08150 [Bacteroidales bacterium]